MKQRLETRLAAMTQSINQSMANHNAMVGRQQELQETLANWDHLNAAEPVAAEAPKAAEPANEEDAEHQSEVEHEAE